MGMSRSQRKETQLGRPHSSSLYPRTMWHGKQREGTGFKDQDAVLLEEQRPKETTAPAVNSWEAPKGWSGVWGFVYSCSRQS